MAELGGYEGEEAVGFALEAGAEEVQGCEVGRGVLGGDGEGEGGWGVGVGGGPGVRGRWG